MLHKAKGIVLKSREIGENDKMITILTSELGIIEAAARRAKSVKSPLSASTQILAYSEFCLYKGKQSYYILDSAETLHTFYALQFDVEKLALASYFCELSDILSPTFETSGEFLRLLLNTLHKLEEGKTETEQLKAIFELRSLSVGGYMPDLVGCSRCGEYEKKKMYFLPLEGRLLCGDCFKEVDTFEKNVAKRLLSPAVMAAMRHIVYSAPEKVYSFRLGKSSQTQLSHITEEYVQMHTERQFRSLGIYHRLAAGTKG